MLQDSYIQSFMAAFHFMKKKMYILHHCVIGKTAAVS